MPIRRSGRIERRGVPRPAQGTEKPLRPCWGPVASRLRWEGRGGNLVARGQPYRPVLAQDGHVGLRLRGFNRGQGAQGRAGGREAQRDDREPLARRQVDRQAPVAGALHLPPRHPRLVDPDSGQLGQRRQGQREPLPSGVLQPIGGDVPGRAVRFVSGLELRAPNPGPGRAVPGIAGRHGHGRLGTRDSVPRRIILVGGPGRRVPVRRGRLRGNRRQATVGDSDRRGALGPDDQRSLLGAGLGKPDEADRLLSGARGGPAPVDLESPAAGWAHVDFPCLSLRRQLGLGFFGGGESSGGQLTLVLRPQRPTQSPLACQGKLNQHPVHAGRLGHAHQPV